MQSILNDWKICCQVGTRGKCHLERQQKCVWIRSENPNKFIFSDFQKLLLKKKKRVARLNLDSLHWSLVEFMETCSSRHGNRVSSTASEISITDFLHNLLSKKHSRGAVIQRGGFDKALCQPVAPDSHVRKGGQTGCAALPFPMVTGWLALPPAEGGSGKDRVCSTGVSVLK